MPSFNIDRGVVSITQLRSDKGFKQLIDFMENHLEQERDLYENTTASDHQRGRVAMLKEIVGELKGQGR